MDAPDPQAAGGFDLLAHWTVYPGFLIGWLLFGAAYLLCAGPLRRRLGAATRVPAWQVASFLTGLAVMFLALQGPLHDLSDVYLFSAHMVQHLLLTLVVPPLLLAGTPAWLVARLLPPGRARGAAGILTRPVPAFALYNVLFALWHVPVLYDWMMRNHDVHVAMHLSILAAAVVMWWPVAGAEPADLPGAGRIPRGYQILYLFLLGLPMMALASIITLADRVLYPWYAAAPRLWGLSPLEDQQLGGLVMWVPGSMVLWVAITVVFFRWSSSKEVAEGSPPRVPEGVRPAPGGRA